MEFQKINHFDGLSKSKVSKLRAVILTLIFLTHKQRMTDFLDIIKKKFDSTN